MNEKYSEDEKEIVLKILAKSETTSPVVISFGFVSEDGQCKNGLILKNAAPAIINMLIKEGCMLSMSEAGLRVTILRK